MLLPSLLTPDLATAHLRRLRPTPEQLTDFGAHLAEMLRHLDPTKIERHGETHILDFLRSVTRPAEGGSRYGNVHNKRDLVLHLGDTADSPVAVVLEVKGPKNPGEMLAPDDLNRKAMQQLLLYYLEDRTDEQADDFRRLIITTGYEWYVFDALDFNRLFWKDKGFVKAFRDWKAGAKADTDTGFFYKSIAGKKLAALDGELRVAYVDLRPGLPTTPAELLALYRLFHPAYLLKEPLTGRRDPNTLNQEFYNELLYLVGLKEEKKGGLRRIGRCPEGERQPGSLLENTLSKLHIGQGLQNVPAAERPTYGDTLEAQYEEVALALCLVWVNRLLFLKLLEGQLVRYHDAADAPHFRFLTPARLADYDDVLNLFFEVLNRPPGERSPEMRAAYPEVPYLNSSLFELSPLESQTFDISGLRNGLGLAPYPGSVLRKAGAPAVPPAKASTSAAPQWAALPYLLHFLDAYDFATDPTGHGPTGHAPAAAGQAPTLRPLLSAAVLGLVFEKINGYRDGSFYTPGFVTMYMARQTLGRALVRHFAQAAAFPELAGCEAVEDLQDALVPAKRARRQEYAAHFNTLTVLDPAVGSGHFLVSALNELLALKSGLGLLLDDEGARLPYTLEVEHDELLVTDADGLPAPYRVGSFVAATGLRTVGPERTRLQRALFREKRALMEHALFGVDLNPNSVRICRLRLWIELLKHAYYKPETDFRELETLPNLDLNVKTGNSLLARFALDVDLTDVFRRGGFTLKKYKEAAHEYFGSRGREDKNKLLGFFQQIKEQFTAELHRKDKKREDLRRYRNQRLVLETQGSLFAGSQKEQDARHFEMRRLELLADKLDADIQAHEQGALFREAFEWRFEFPEVLDDAGAFRGFDVVIGNPPYIRADEQPADFRKALLASKRFVTLSEKWDLFVPFLELGFQLLKPSGEMAMIVSDGYCFAKYAKTSHDWFLTHATVERIDFMGKLQIFPEAAVSTVIPYFIKRKATEEDVPLRRLHEKSFGAVRELPTGPQSTLTNSAFSPNENQQQKFKAKTSPLEDICYISVGLVPHADEKLALGAFKLSDLVAKAEDETHPKPFVEGKQITDWLTSGNNWLEWGTARAPSLFRRQTFPQLYTVPSKLLAMRIAGQRVRVCLDERQLLCNHTVIVFVPWHQLKAVRNNSLKKTAQYRDEAKAGKEIACPTREDLEALSQQYDAKYLLAVMHSGVAWSYLQNVRRSNTDLYPDDWKQLPIPAATPAEQAAIAALVQQILDIKAAPNPADSLRDVLASTAPAPDTSKLEAAVDAAVAALYGVALPVAAAVAG